VNLMELEDMSAGPLAMLIGCHTIGIIVSLRCWIMNIYCARRVYLLDFFPFLVEKF